MAGRLLNLRDSQRRGLWRLVVLGAAGVVLLSLGGLSSPGVSCVAPAAGPASAPVGGEAGGVQQGSEAVPAASLGRYGTVAEAVAGTGYGRVPAAPTTAEDWQKELEASLERVLSQIEGAGKVVVMVALASGPRWVPARQPTERTTRTEERDAGGGTRTVVEEERSSPVVVERREGGGEQAMVEEVRGPEVTGAVVVADGAADPEVRSRLVLAACTALGLPAHRVVVLPSRGGGARAR
ncbi:MAG: hypothetical protein K6T75_00300 [Acetobacteraceae bacterium]|nr:hypothetical protein [Acetobacteraceae bacterium]